MPSLMQVGHCSLASLLHPAVSHTRASTAAMLPAATAATGATQADGGRAAAAATGKGRRERRNSRPGGSRLKQGGAPGPACPPPALSAL